MSLTFLHSFHESDNVLVSQSKINVYVSEAKKLRLRRKTQRSKDPSGRCFQASFRKKETAHKLLFGQRYIRKGKTREENREVEEREIIHSWIMCSNIAHGENYFRRQWQKCLSLEGWLTRISFCKCSLVCLFTSRFSPSSRVHLVLESCFLCFGFSDRQPCKKERERLYSDVIKAKGMSVWGSCFSTHVAVWRDETSREPSIVARRDAQKRYWKIYWASWKPERKVFGNLTKISTFLDCNKGETAVKGYTNDWDIGKWFRI